MNRIAILLLIGALTALMVPQRAFASTDKLLEWTSLPAIPDAEGVAGPFAGVAGGALIVAGGANFPDGKPWEGGKKIWHDEAYVLAEGASEWRSGFKLPRPIGYGVSITTDKGVLCIGGEDPAQVYGDVFMMKWDGKELSCEEMPSLPTPVASATGVLLGNSVYVLGGASRPAATDALHSFLKLDLDDLAAGWQTLESWPGPARILATAGALDGSVYLFGGASLAAGPDGKPLRTYLKDAYRFVPGKGWQQIAEMPRPAVAAPAPAVDAGQSHLLLVGGDDGSKVGFEPMSEHPGFPRTILAYHTITNTWVEKDEEAPFGAVTVPVVRWKGGFVVPSGEVRPGVRSPLVWSGKFLPQKAAFGALNFATLAGYLLLVLGVGLYCTRFNVNTEDYFRGGQRIPWWAAGLSIFATTLSSITFMSIPAKAYSTNWVFLLANLPILLLAPFIVFCILPVFRRIDATSAYEYLEKRFNLPVRLFGGASFVLFQLGRMSIVMFLPALALAAVTDFDVYTCIALMGVLTVVYCVFGGITAVIWTDVVQSVVLLGGALLSFVLIIMHTDGGFGSFVDIASSAGKFHMVEWSLDWTVPALWVVILGNLFSNLIPYTSDQAVVQRYMTTTDEKSAARSVWLNGLIAMPATLLFFLVGTGLYVHYVQHPELLTPGFQNDAIFPLFIARELPAGIAGIVVAGIFAAAQSTVSTSMNSTSTVLVTDFIKRLRRSPMTSKQEMAMAHWTTGVLGVLGTAGALLLAAADIKSLWDVFIQMLGLTGGALAGLFMLGIFTSRANGKGALVGAVASVVTLFCVQRYTHLHFFLYAGVGICTCIGVGYVSSLLLGPPEPASVRGLTIHSIEKTASPTAAS